MPEALVVLGVLVVALVAWFGAWLHARNPANYNPEEEAARLRDHAAWLQHRLEVARRENWGHEMVAGITEELGATSRQLAQISGRGAVAG